jgi:signal transduction histidine kinase
LALGVTGRNLTAVFFGVFIAIYMIAAIFAWPVQPDFTPEGSKRVIAHSLWHDPAARDAPTLFRSFNGDALSGFPLRVLVPAHTGDVAVTINGRALEPMAAEPHSAISRYHHMTLFTVPDGLVAKAGNKLEIERSGTMRFLTVPDVLIGREAVIDRLASQQRWLLTWVDQATLIMMTAGVVISLLLLFLSRRIAHYFYLFLMFGELLLLEFRNSISLFGHPLVSFIHYFGLAYLLLSALSFSYWTHGDTRERRISVQLFAVSVALCLIGDIGWGVESEATVWVRMLAFIIPSLLLLAWVLLRLLRRVRQFDLAETLVFACLAAFGFAFGVALITIWGGPVSSEGRLFLVCLTNGAEVTAIMGLLGTAAGHEWMSYRNTMTQRQRLDVIASGTMMALEEETARLKQKIEGQAVQDERQRFTRDLHDGIGGQLLSLLLKARTGTIHADRLESEIARCISDLRLITAALEVGDDSLTSALAAFHARSDDQLRLADMTLHWQCDDSVDRLGASPHVTLELLRILQELVTNAINHAHADALSISLHAAPMATSQSVEGDGLHVIVSDTGGAFDPSRAQLPGRGLANMQARVLRLEGRAEIGLSPSGGAHIRLAIPIGRTD